MGILDWFRGRKAKQDDETLEQAEAQSVESPDVPAAAQGDVEGLAADREAAEQAGAGTTIDDAERLSE